MISVQCSVRCDRCQLREPKTCLLDLECEWECDECLVRFECLTSDREMTVLYVTPRVFSKLES
jgi:hypothetical protein